MSFRKSFVFIDDHIKTRRLKNHRVNVYRVKNNRVTWVHEFYYTSGTTPGAEAEVLRALIRIGEIPKKWLQSSTNSWSGPGYYSGPVRDVYSIKELRH